MKPSFPTLPLRYGVIPPPPCLYLSTKPTQIKYSFLLQHADEAFDLIQHYMSRL